MKVTARGIAAGVAGAITLGAFSLLATAQQNDDAAQDRARQLRQQQQQPQQQQTQRTGSADAAWDRVADLHREIVRMEISQQGSTTTQPGQQDRSENRSTNQPDRDANPIIRDRSGNQPGRTATDRTSRASAGESRSDALWDQLAQKHAQLVQAKLKGESDEGAAGQPSRRQPTQPAQPGQPGQPAQPAQPGQPGRTDVAGSQTERLEREIGQLYMQILAVDLAEARGSRRALRPDLDQRDPSDRSDTPRTPDRKSDN